jgi:hypothetical protein
MLIFLLHWNEKDGQAIILNVELACLRKTVLVSKGRVAIILSTMKVEGQVSQAETRCYLEDGIGVVVMMNKWSIAYKECTICHEDCELVRKAVINV